MKTLLATLLLAVSISSQARSIHPNTFRVGASILNVQKLQMVSDFENDQILEGKVFINPVLKTAQLDLEVRYICHDRICPAVYSMSKTLNFKLIDKRVDDCNRVTYVATSKELNRNIGKSRRLTIIDNAAAANTCDFNKLMVATELKYEITTHRIHYTNGPISEPRRESVELFADVIQPLF